MVKEVCSDAVEIVEPAKEGYQLTLKLDFAKIPGGKGLLLLQIIQMIYNSLVGLTDIYSTALLSCLLLPLN